jgi:pimeloyl-ACP methyl ester carboxylesterase
MIALAATLAMGLTGFEALPYGKSMVTLNLDNTPIEVYCYKPLNYDRERMIMVMHGTLRNADEYRDDSAEMAEHTKALIIAPKFDAERFPSRRYHRGGLLREDGSAAPPSEWTYRFIPMIAKEIQRREEYKLRYWIIGHSAGGQFVVRMAAFWNTGAERLVAANAGSQLFPTRDLPFGYGFGNLPDELSNDARLKAFLAAPLTLYQGTADNKSDEYFDESADAMKQGPGRLQRGQAMFQRGRELAKEKGWPFHWRYVETKGIGHDHTLMFNSRMADMALFGRHLGGPKFGY